MSARTRRPGPQRLAPLLGTPALALAVTVGAACGSRGGDTATNAGDVQPAVSVQTAVVTRQPFTESVGAFGAVVPRAGHLASLSAPGPARVAHIYVSVGQHVARGAPLVEFDQAPFVAATQSAEATLTAAQRAYDRAQRLADAGIIPRKDADQAAADLAKARVDVVTARRAQQFSVLRAPITGVVTRMTTTLGGSVDASQPVVEVADPAALDILLNVTPGDAARVHPGAAITLSAGQGAGSQIMKTQTAASRGTDAPVTDSVGVTSSRPAAESPAPQGSAGPSAGGEQLGLGRVVDVAGTVDSASRSVSVRVQVVAPRRPLRIGETVFGRIAVATHPSALTVPLDALVPEGDGFKVFVVDSAGVAHSRPVTIGGQTTQVAEVTSGLTTGERIVTYGAYGVQDSAKVVPVKR